MTDRKVVPFRRRPPHRPSKDRVRAELDALGIHHHKPGGAVEALLGPLRERLRDRTAAQIQRDKELAIQAELIELGLAGTDEQRAELRARREAFERAELDDSGDPK